MLKKAIKKILSERQLEKFLRTKQYLHDADTLNKKYKVLPPVRFRVGDEVITVSPIADITVAGWRNLLKLYDKASNTEKEEFKDSVQSMILADPLSIKMLETAYIKKVFAGHQSLYFEFLAIAYYVTGDLQKSYNVFGDLNRMKSSEKNWFHMARCLMHIADENAVIKLLNEAIAEYPSGTLLLLSLANAHFRKGETALANQTLAKIDSGVLNTIKQRAHNVETLGKEIKEALAAKTIVRTAEQLGFQAYTEDSVQEYWETLFYHFTQKTRFQHGWSDLCYITESKIEAFLKSHPDIKSVLNFGVFCAVPDYNLALKNPGVDFIGADREQSTKNLNDSAFKADNLSFHAIDMLDIIYDEKTEVKDFLQKKISEKGEMMIFHARTATLIYPEALKRFYKACAKNGVKYIALYENSCLSRSAMQYYDFDNLPEDSIPYFSIMMIHNYKKFLGEAGYEIVDQQIWNYSDLLWSGKDLYGAESFFCLGDGHAVLLAKLK